MNAEFEAYCRRVPELFAELMKAPLSSLTDKSESTPGIYVFFEGNEPIYVGRTRNFRQRMRAHLTPRHNSASFAFKLLRKHLNLPASYTKAGSRAAMQITHAQEFSRQVDRVKAMKVRFLTVSNPIEQYLLELYTAMELSKVNPMIDMQDFDTH